ncbi:hypothetical protein [Kribbella sp. CA-293567]|uniref:hypothetical protein n=1 Tax=Kribbella sp. CA-293567 TaxID=3002436 RepID=UPI0022DE7CF4|nr:hypothetical protein [Kribbella sp. CA-293567]WBQ03830.1 hypothetical protein OX958_28150 [Kribbella sp. CA-293567]
MHIDTAHKTKTSTGEWCGARGEQLIAYKTKSLTGERVVAIRWPEGSDRFGFAAGDVELKHITGDAWHKPEAFVEHHRMVLPNGTNAEVAAYVAERLG